MSYLQRIYDEYYLSIFPSYKKILKEVVQDMESLLDVGCGENSPVRWLPKDIYRVGIDAYSPCIQRSKEKGIHNEYVNMDVLDLDKKFEKNSYDCVLASDVIEHLEKEDGVKLIKMMEKVAKKKVVILTPNGFLKQDQFDDNSLQVHRSGWSVKEMEEMGYKVIGINGWKVLRGACGFPTFQPKAIVALLSNVSQFFLVDKPESAFQILCIKTK